MDKDIVSIYKKLSRRYPIALSSSLTLGFKSNIDFPVLHGESTLGRFELFYEDVSFAFYAMRESGELYAHWHSQTISGAEESVRDFMEGKLTVKPFKQP